uniref:Uncharacterized protein n=1 Tax=Anguilla anguilla TaxID=7936 RepID=A0A0E9Q0W4_ANGAN
MTFRLCISACSLPSKCQSKTINVYFYSESEI